MNNDYEDIIHLPHPVSHRYPQMSMSQRAAQFAPFAALSGHAAALAESARETTQRICLSPDQQQLLDRRLTACLQRIDNKPMLLVTYFVADRCKEGGAYHTVKGRLTRLREESMLLSREGSEETVVIPFEAVLSFEELTET